MSLEKQRTVSASYINTLLDAFSDGQGDVKAESILASAAVAPEQLSDPDARLPVETVSKLWQAARVETGDGLIGLKVGRHIRPGSFSVLGHLLMTCASLQEALEQAARFAVLVGDGGILTVSHSSGVSDGAAVLVYDLVDKDIPCRKERIEAILACLVVFAKWITGTKIVPEEVRFTHAAPEDTGAYLDAFGVLPMFEQADNAVVIAATDLKRPLTQANAALSSILSRHAEAILSKLTDLDPLLHGLRQRLLQQLPGQPPELEEIAAAFGLTGRSLQRRLSALGTSFQAELSGVRRETAFEYLLGNLPISETAYLLGFADSAGFHRAFKRWTGVTPRKWLEENGGGRTD